MQEHRGAIVVVEDDHSVSQAVGRLLRAAGFHVLLFDSAEALLAGGGAQHAACLIIDIHLPGMSGLELCAKLRETAVSAPVVFITARDNAGYRQAAMKIGAAYLTKPFAGHVLIEAVESAMAGPSSSGP
ncbi:MAG TPA: response regulator [Steroidobacter sp.]|nr:response regulator [Steroidobacter sp.]